jgi:uncharacterized protein
MPSSKSRPSPLNPNLSTPASGETSTSAALSAALDRRAFLAAAFGVVGAALLPACGDDDDGDTSGSTDTGAATGDDDDTSTTGGTGTDTTGGTDTDSGTGTDTGATEDTEYTENPNGLPSVAIIGGGSAAIFAAWLLDGKANVTVYESWTSLFGNVAAKEIDYEGEKVVVDLGAQYFNPGPYPLYIKLLTQLGLHNPTDLSKGITRSNPSSTALLRYGEEQPRFISTLPFESWNGKGIGAFAKVAPASRKLFIDDADYTTTLETWLRKVGIDQETRDKIMIPWTASLFSGSIAEARGYSARASMTFLGLALTSDTQTTAEYLTMVGGLGVALQTLLDETTTVATKVSAKVTGLSRRSDGKFRVVAENNPTQAFDHLIMAAPGHAAAPLLAGVSGAEAIAEAVGGIQFHDTNIKLHADATYALADTKYQAFLNSSTDDVYCEGSMKLATVLPPTSKGEPVNLWKSWAQHRPKDPANILATIPFKHMIPSVDSIRAQQKLAGVNGQNGVWVIGGYTKSYDSQETALLTAIAAAKGLGFTSAKITALEG